MAEQQTSDEAREQQVAELLAIATVLAAGGGIAPLATAIIATFAVPERVALEVARIAIVDVPEVSVASGFARQVQEDALIYRAAYIRAAVRRLRSAGDIGDQSFAAALDGERNYFELHRAQELRRATGGKQVAEAISRYGDLLGWYAEIRPTSRPNHRAAHGHNFRPLLGPPALTTAYPGVLPNCLCEVGPPVTGATEIH